MNRADTVEIVLPLRASVPSCLRASGRGFSLAELMIALAILGIGLLFIAAALPVGISYSRDSIDFSAGSGAADEAFQTIQTSVRMSRQLAANPLVRDGAWGSPALYPTGSSPSFYPIRVDNLFRPRHMPPLRPAIPPGYPYPHGADLEPPGQSQTQPMPREGSYDHPFADPTTLAADHQHGDSRDDGYEPVIKVRPLTMGNLSVARRGNGPASHRDPVVDDGEEIIGRYVSAVGLVNFAAAPPNPPQPMLEADVPTILVGFFPGRSLALIDNLPFTPLARFFPAVTPKLPYRAEQFVNVADPPANVYRRYFVRNVPNAFNDQINRPTGYAAVEFDKAAERRITWTAFYRRVAYDDVRPGLLPTSGYDGPPPPQGTGDDLYYPADRQLYEFIVVVTRKPSARHRFARQDVSSGGIAAFEQPRAILTPAPTDTRGGDRVAPMPWLVVADTRMVADYRSTAPGDPDGIMQGLMRVTTPAANTGPDTFLDTWISRPLSPNFAERSTLKFVVRSSVGRLLAPGSVLIPAANDNFPHFRPATPSLTNYATPVNRVAGFVPHTPDSLPIYEVLEVIPDEPGSGSDRTTVVVKNNGAYPWVGPTGTLGNNMTAKFPFWVIPPSFTERDSNDQPVFEKSSPIIGVYRKIIRIPEVQ